MCIYVVSGIYVPCQTKGLEDKRKGNGQKEKGKKALSLVVGVIVGGGEGVGYTGVGGGKTMLCFPYTQPSLPQPCIHSGSEAAACALAGFVEVFFFFFFLKEKQSSDSVTAQCCHLENLTFSVVAAVVVGRFSLSRRLFFPLPLLPHTPPNKQTVSGLFRDSSPARSAVVRLFFWGVFIAVRRRSQL